MTPFLLPVVAIQGLWVRWRTEVLPPAAGPATGVTEGSGSPFRLGVIGDSTAAGCGASTHAQALPGQLAAEITSRTGRPVEWSVIGQYGATSQRIRHKLLPDFDTDLDLAVLLAGVNDVLGRRSAADWTQDLSAIIDDLSARAGHVAVVGMPPFADFPSLPGVLSRYLASCAAQLDEASAEVCGGRARATWVQSVGAMRVTPDFFARDGFHPAAGGYRSWARVVADRLDSFLTRV